MKKKHLLFVLVLLTGLGLIFGGFYSLYPQTRRTRVIRKVLPDLTVTNVKFFSQNVFKIEATVFNKGAADSKPCILELKVGCGSLKTLTANIPALKATIPGAWPNVKSRHTVTFTSPFALNTVMSVLTADSTKVVTERNENNNTWRKDNCIK